MAWKDLLEQRFIIETGDGKQYFPKWMNPVYSQEYNVSIFDFPFVQGSFVRRGEARGRVFNLQIHFDGDNHIADAEEFRISSIDRRQWRVLHPYYGDLRVQPIRSFFDNRGYNLSKITIRVMETINAGLPARESAFDEDIAARKEALDELTASDFVAQTDQIQAQEVALISDTVNDFEAVADTVVEVEDEQIDFRNQVINATNAATNVINDANNAIRSIQTVINFPAQITATVRVRVDTLIDSFNRLITSIGNLAGTSRNNKVYIANTGATVVSATSLAFITNPDFQTREQVTAAMLDVLNLYNNYIVAIDEMQTPSQTEVTSWTISPEVLKGVTEIINFTLSNLERISLNSQQTHVIVTDRDTNAIIMSHRVYGSSVDDSRLERFLETNNIGLSEILEIKKDRELIYFIGGDAN